MKKYSRLIPLGEGVYLGISFEGETLTRDDANYLFKESGLKGLMNEKLLALEKLVKLLKEKENNDKSR